MMKLIICFFLFLPFALLAQNDQPIMVVKKIINGKVCDSCLVSRAGNLDLLGSNKQVSFLTLNHENQFLYTDSALTKNFLGTSASRFYISVAKFSLDFYSFIQQQQLLNSKQRSVKSDLTDLQFRIAVNGKSHDDWTDITSLDPDHEFYIGNSKLGDLSQFEDQPKTIPVQNFHAGQFTLAVGDSIVVFIRSKIEKEKSYQFSTHRVKSVPDSFDFIQFSSTASFEDILNNEVNKRRTERTRVSDSLEMEAGNSAFLRFDKDYQFQFFGQTQRNSGIEYATSYNPNDWRDLGGKNTRLISEYSYIYIHNPKADQTIKVFLRYKHQRENRHTVTIRVKKAPGMAKWIYWATGFVVLTFLILIVYFMQKRLYARKLRLLNRKKREVENQLQLLNGQLNPHFLFNSLNAAQGLIRKNDAEAASEYISEVATFLRTIMDCNKKDFVSLKEELLMKE
ncbi:histidine kinase [Dyadobacter luticola]|uniref:Histidine kinase n=1 Tax=Dyadobacter luticola TaxID=1979387 RepID=A0A5R9L3B3_9BACT|nr:histidine kinase [Dyadobacter luticola]TLV02849.1 histidine kinase [Dyadobacter luticola]